MMSESNKKGNIVDSLTADEVYQHYVEKMRYESVINNFSTVNIDSPRPIEPSILNKRMKSGRSSKAKVTTKFPHEYYDEAPSEFNPAEYYMEEKTLDSGNAISKSSKPSSIVLRGMSAIGIVSNFKDVNSIVSTLGVQFGYNKEVYYLLQEDKDKLQIIRYNDKCLVHTPVGKLAPKFMDIMYDSKRSGFIISNGIVTVGSVKVVVAHAAPWSIFYLKPKFESFIHSFDFNKFKKVHVGKEIIYKGEDGIQKTATVIKYEDTHSPNIVQVLTAGGDLEFIYKNRIL